MLDLGERKAKPGVRWFRDGMGHEWLILCICTPHSSDSAQHAARVVGCGLWVAVAQSFLECFEFEGSCIQRRVHAEHTSGVEGFGKK